MGSMEAEKMVKDLDLDGDGVISQSEFSLWWLAGRHGKVCSMGKLLRA
jgi:Ca2+-binding EF-hand superfamily protein